LTKSCFASAAHEEIVAIEAFREVSAIGKEMIDGNRAVAAVAASIVMDSNVFPTRNSTRDKETTKEVVDTINKYGLIPDVGQAEVWKGSYFCAPPTCTTLLLTLPVASRFWRTSLRVSTSVLATVLTSPSFVRATAVNLADIPR